MIRVCGGRYFYRRAVTAVQYIIIYNIIIVYDDARAVAAGLGFYNNIMSEYRIICPIDKHPRRT